MPNNMPTFELYISVECRIVRQVEATDEMSAKINLTRQIADGEFSLEDHIREIRLDDIELIDP